MDVSLQVINLVLLFRNFLRGGPLLLASISLDPLELLSSCSAHNGGTALGYLVEVVAAQIAEILEALETARVITLA